MRYGELVEVYEKLSQTTKKLEKVDILAEFLPKIKNNQEWIYLLRGRVFPGYDEREFGISRQLVIKALSRASGISSEKIVKRFNKIGDLGDVANEIIGKKNQSTLFSKKLDVDKVFNSLRKISVFEGKGSVDKKLGVVVDLLTSASGVEARYVIRTLLNDLRVGVADAILRDAISEAFFKDDKGMAEKVEEAYDKVNDFALVFLKASKGKNALSKMEVIPGRPTKVMLPVKVTDLDEAFRICGKKVAVEHKYDGFRVLINKQEKEISLFTRKLENVTKQFPDIVDVVRKNVKGKSFVLDSEVIGYDAKKKTYVPFEFISQRIKRKHDIEKLVKKIPVEVNVFDVVYFNGESRINVPFFERRKLIEKIVKVVPWKIRLSKQIVTDDADAVRKFYKDALKIGEEGVMIKSLEAPYRPGRRVGYMVKMKPESKDLDLVIVGAEYGTGKRAGGLTSFIVACKNGKDNFLEVGKVSSGLKEKEEEGTTYREINDLLKPLIIKEKGNSVSVKPKVIVSLTYQNIQPSTKYSSGYALRFPRITHYRPERGIYDTATLDDIKKEFARMKKLGSKRGIG